MHITCPNCATAFEYEVEIRIEPGERVVLPCQVCGSDIPVDGSAELPAALRIDEYELVKSIASGGMGEVFLGYKHGDEGFRTEVAIKRLLPQHQQREAFVKNFIEEARLTQLLKHPNIVEVRDVKRANQSLFVVLEYFNGVDGARLLEQAITLGIHIPQAVTYHLVFQLLDALAYAHALTYSNGEPVGIIHRDVSPANLLIDRTGWLKLTDFGIAKARYANDRSSTKFGEIKGKLGYMGPEAFSNARDETSDLFAAAIVCWEFLVAERYFVAENEAAMIAKISACDYRDPCALVPDIPQTVSLVLRRALLPDPSARFVSGMDFSTALLDGIAPLDRTACANEARLFFAENTELFDSLQVYESSPSPTPRELPTKILPIVDKHPLLRPVIEPDTETLEPVSAPPALPQPQRSRRFVVLLVFAAGFFGVAANHVWSSSIQSFVESKAERTTPIGSGAEAIPDKASERARIGIMVCFNRHAVDVPADGKSTFVVSLSSTGAVETVESRPSLPARLDDCVRRAIRRVAFLPSSTTRRITLPVSFSR